MLLWNLKRTSGAATADDPAGVNASTRDEFGGSFSSDSGRVAFASDRGGGLDIWVSDWDGSGLHRVTHTNGVGTAHPTWSPDGHSIAFQAAEGGNPEVYVVGADGGAPRRVTSSRFRDAFPSWSRDGRWIYFASDRSGTFQIWKVPVGGGEPVQVSVNGGFEAQESADGTTLYFLARPPAAGTGTMESSRLMQVSTSGGQPSVLIDRVWPFHWSVVSQGIYYLTLDGRRDEVLFYHVSTKRTTHVATLPRPVSRIDGRASISPDGRWLLTTHVDREDVDFMVVHDFR
jgi:Tol biopolymer transport system component